MKIIAIFIAIIAIVAGVFYLNRSKATIDNYSLRPLVALTDDVAGAVDADYDFEYQTSAILASGTMTEITVTFPNSYTITNGPLDPITAFNSSTQNGCTAVPGYICFDGNDGDHALSSMVGSNTTNAKKITITFDPVDLTGVTSYDVRSRILEGITNTTLAGVPNDPHNLFIGDPGFTIDDDAPGNTNPSTTPLTVDSDVTIIAAPATHLVIMQEPSGPASSGQETISGTAFDIQPVLEAHDQYENLDMNYAGFVELNVASGTGTISTSAPVSSPCASVVGGVDMEVVGGIADFSTMPIAYGAGVDHESFTLKATGFCNSVLPEVDFIPLTSDVVASALTWTRDPALCSTGVVCTTQGRVEAQGPGAAGGLTTDIEYSGSVALSSTGAGALLGTSPQSLTAGLLNIVGLGYTNTAPGNEKIHFHADTGSLAQGVSGEITITGPGQTPTPPSPTPSGPNAGGTATNPQDIPGYVPPTPSVEPTPGTCAPYLVSYVRRGDAGEQVSKLQKFLFVEGSYIEGLITGFFGTLTENAVNRFQTKYAADILTPQGLSGPTGYAKDYTGRKINGLVCSKTVAI